MTFYEQVVTITLCALASVLTRAVPFLVFSPSKPTPALVRYLGNALPSAIFAMLIVYCLKNTSFLTGWHGLPELAGIICTVIIHLWLRQMLISTLVGTVVYMLLVQIFFP